MTITRDLIAVDVGTVVVTGLTVLSDDFLFVGPSQR
jgi:hypothetical protein